jgi:bifunctional ADP-heptose synthase (sugar kinase/adenylyltransferase)
MNSPEIIRDIKNLNIYTSEQFSEYCGYFRQKDKLIRYLHRASTKQNELGQRIKTNRGATPIEPDYSISEMIVDVNFIRNSKKSKVIGIVSGCYDLLHLGHLRGFAYAKKYLLKSSNSQLLALILSDRVIRAKKGETRPVLNINERIAMLSQVDCLDYILPLEGQDCLRVLCEIRPDYFFKAKSDKSQDIVKLEIETVEKNGGRVVVFPHNFDEGYISTTRLLESVLNK